MLQEDTGEIPVKSTPHILSDRGYMSVVVTSFFRPFYLARCLESLKQFADMPYEVIVHDDGSNMDIKKQILEHHENISTLILNLGGNMGLNVSANRCCSIAQSKYILFLNDDVVLTKPCFKNIASILDKEYVGWVSPLNGELSNMVNLTRNHAITSNLGGGSALAFRKEVWEEVDGWSENNTSGQSDNVFILKILREGYFKGLMKNGPFIRVEDCNDPSYIAAFGFTQGRDCSYPKLINVSKERNEMLGHKRREYCQWWVDGERTVPNRETFDNRQNPEAGLNDFGFWGDYTRSIIPANGQFDWAKAEKFGHVRWKSAIEKDLE